VFFYGIHETKKRVIEFLQDTLGNRPLFSRVTIQNAYGKTERDKINVIVTGSSNQVQQLSPDNFLQADIGYSIQAKVDNHPGYFLAWVRDDLSSPESNLNRVDPGIYFLTLKNVDQQGGILQIDVLRVVKREVVLFNYTGETQIQLEHFPVVEGTLQLFVDNSLYPPNAPADYYDVDLETGIITLNRCVAPGSRITANYNWADAPLPDVPVLRGDGRTDVLTGVLLGFSEEFVEGDRSVVCVQPQPERCALTFGGRLGVTLTFDTRAQDTPTSEQVVDALMDTIWAEAKPTLSDEGLDIVEVSVGGESTDLEDETAEEWAFQFSFTADVEGEWQRRVPLLRRYHWEVVNLPADVDILSATDEELVEASLRFLDNTGPGPRIELPSF
jgi:hypothetical protein